MSLPGFAFTAHKPQFHHGLELWKNYHRDGFFKHQLDRWLSQELKKHPRFGKNDRRFYSEMLFLGARFTMTAAFLYWREKESLCRLIDIFHSPEEFEKYFWKTPPQALFELIFERVKGLKCEVDHMEELDRNLIWNGIPLWWKGFIVKRAKKSQWMKKDLNKFCQGQTTRPPIYIRINHLNEKNEVMEELKSHGFEIENLENISEKTLKVTGDYSLFNLDSYQSGMFEIQDLASQCLGFETHVTPQDWVWDTCAGQGGKTLLLASEMNQKNALYASDNRDYALKTCQLRVKRARFDNVRTFVWTGNEPPILSREISKRGGFTKILIDAPCSNTGTWRRNPDARFRQNPTRLNDLFCTQKTILKNALAALSSKGELHFATCSFLVEENENLVEEVVKNNPALEIMNSNLYGFPFLDSDTTSKVTLQKKE